jgi:energy-coupling factor transporter transmembrane protein EcfT
MITSVGIVVLFTLAASSHIDTIWGRLIIAAGKMVTISLLIMLFSLTTQPNEIFQLLKPSGLLFPAFQPTIYIFTTILAVFPSIQYDLLRAVDAETIRMGKRVMFYHFTSWLSILTVVLVRTLNRAERFTDTVIDRGYLPANGLRLLKSRRIRLVDFLILLVLVLPGLIFWMVVI